MWIKNIKRGKDTLARAENVGEGEAPLVSVPRANRRRGEREGVNAARKPEDEHRVAQADERSCSLHRGFFSGGRVGEPQQLLKVAEGDLDRPALRVALENFADRDARVGAEEDAKPDRALGDANDNDAQQARTAGAVPLRRALLVFDGSQPSVQVSAAATPWNAPALREQFGFRQDLPPRSWSAGCARTAIEGWRGEYGVRTHRAEEHEIRRQRVGDGVIAVGAVSGELD